MTFVGQMKHYHGALTIPVQSEHSCYVRGTSQESEIIFIFLHNIIIFDEVQNYTIFFTSTDFFAKKG
jgi:hypothetical protein